MQEALEIKFFSIILFCINLTSYRERTKIQIIKSQKDFSNCRKTNKNILLTFTLIIGSGTQLCIRTASQLSGLCWELLCWCHPSLQEKRCLDDDKFVVYFLRQKVFVFVSQTRSQHVCRRLSNQGEWLEKSAQNPDAGNLSLGIIMFLSGKRAGFGFTQVCICSLVRIL